MERVKRPDQRAAITDPGADDLAKVPGISK
jgi:hypothetical protein